MTGQSTTPQSWEVCGWVRVGVITSLVLAYGHGPDAGFSVMPRVGVPASECPPLDSLGPRFGEYRREGRLVSLNATITGTFAIVYWVPVTRIPDAGAGLIAVAETLTPDAVTWALPQGMYVYHRAQTPGARMPSLDAALNHPDRIDLGLRLAAATRRKVSR